MQLPPLKSLPYFIAVAKHKHFSQAASELNVTPGAISQQIKQLEQYLGCMLFTRDTKQVELTTEGIGYYKDIEQALSQIEHATGKIKPLDHNTIQIRLLSTLAIQWLIPRLADLYLTHPEINLNLMTFTENRSQTLDNADLIIQLADNKPNPQAHKLWSNQLILTYNSAKIQSSNLDKSAAIIVNHPLRDLDWKNYCTSTGFIMPNKKILVSSTMQAIQAVENGLGSLVTHLPLIYPLIDKKTLQIFGKPIATEQSYYLIDSQPHRYSKNKQIIFNWLIDQATKYLHS